jgi:hypothetical protein
MVALGTDGPNTMKKVQRLFNVKLEGLRGYGLLEIGTCSLNIINNAFGKAFETWNSDKVLYHTAKFFEGSVKRIEVLIQSAETAKVKFSGLASFVESRWLFFCPAVEKVIACYPAIKQAMK